MIHTDTDGTPELTGFTIVQSTLVNSKLQGLVVLLGIISSSTYREIDMKVYKLK